MKFLILLLLLLNTTIVRANICAGLFLESRPSEAEINKVILDLGELMTRSYSKNVREAWIAQRLFNQKLNELTKYLQKDEIRNRLQSLNLKPENKEISFEIQKNQEAIFLEEAAKDRILREFLDKQKLKDIDDLDFRGWSVLMIAARDGNKEILEILISKKVDLNERMNNGNKTALMIASVNGRKDIVELLLLNGVDVNAKDIHDETALISAARSSDVEITRLLLEAGAEINAKMNSNFTALMKAAQLGHKDHVVLLLSHGADVTVRSTPSPRTALEWAKNNEHEQVVEALIAAGVME